MEEIFKDILGYEGRYQVSNFGNVKSLSYNKTGKAKILTPGITKNGYCLVRLYNKNKKMYPVHQLVAMCFLDHMPCGYKFVVNHIDHNPLNNRIDNLEVVTQRQNASDRKTANSSSKYTGVSWFKSHKKYAAQIVVNGKNIRLGFFEYEEEASKAYQKALSKL